MKWKFWQKFKDDIGQATGGTASPAETSGSNPLQELLNSIEETRSSALNVDDGALASRLGAEKRKAAQEEEDRRTQQHRRDMLDDIMKLHAQLGTGLSESDVEGLSEGVKESLELYSHRSTDSLADLGLRAILRSLHRDALATGWDRLESKMADAKQAWPPPSGISPNTTPEEIQRKTELHNVIVHKEFLSYDFKLLAELIHGAVPAWRSVYPERGGVVWQGTCYQAVGAALTAQRHNELQEMAQGRVDDIRKAVAVQLEPALRPIQAELKKGVDSLSIAMRLSEEAGRISERVSVETFWKIIGIKRATAGQSA